MKGGRNQLHEEVYPPFFCFFVLGSFEPPCESSTRINNKGYLKKTKLLTVELISSFYFKTTNCRIKSKFLFVQTSSKGSLKFQDTGREEQIPRPREKDGGAALHLRRPRMTVIPGLRSIVYDDLNDGTTDNDVCHLDTHRRTQWRGGNTPSHYYDTLVFAFREDFKNS